MIWDKDFDPIPFLTNFFLNINLFYKRNSKESLNNLSLIYMIFNLIKNI